LGRNRPAVSEEKAERIRRVHEQEPDLDAGMLSHRFGVSRKIIYGILNRTGFYGRQDEGTGHSTTNQSVLE